MSSNSLVEYYKLFQLFINNLFIIQYSASSAYWKEVKSFKSFYSTK